MRVAALLLFVGFCLKTKNGFHIWKWLGKHHLKKKRDRAMAQWLKGLVLLKRPKGQFLAPPLGWGS